MSHGQKGRGCLPIKHEKEEEGISNGKTLYRYRQLDLCKSNSDKNPGRLYFKLKDAPPDQPSFVAWASPKHIQAYNRTMRKVPDVDLDEASTTDDSDKDFEDDENVVIDDLKESLKHLSKSLKAFERFHVMKGRIQKKTGRLNKSK